MPWGGGGRPPPPTNFLLPPPGLRPSLASPRRSLSPILPLLDRLSLALDPIQCLFGSLKIICERGARRGICMWKSQSCGFWVALRTPTLCCSRTPLPLPFPLLSPPKCGRLLPCVARACDKQLFFPLVSDRLPARPPFKILKNSIMTPAISPENS